MYINVKTKNFVETPVQITHTLQKSTFNLPLSDNNRLKEYKMFILDIHAVTTICMCWAKSSYRWKFGMPFDKTSNIWSLSAIQIWRPVPYPSWLRLSKPGVRACLFRLSHHHLAELVKVHGAAAVLVQLLNDAVQFFICERGQELPDESSQCFGGDVAQSLLVVDPEGVLEFSLHGLDVGVLHQEGGAQLTKFTKLDLTGPVLVNFFQKLLELLLAGPESHGPHDLVQVVGGQKLLLLCVEQVEAHLETLDLIDGEAGGFSHLVKVNISVGVGLGHSETVSGS